MRGPAFPLSPSASGMCPCRARSTDAVCWPPPPAWPRRPSPEVCSAPVSPRRHPARTRPTGTRSTSTRRPRSGSRTPSSASTSTGASSASPPSTTSGTRATCTTTVGNENNHHSRDLRRPVGVAVPQLHQRRAGQGGQLRAVRAEAEVGRRQLRPGRVGAAVRRRRREVRRAGRRAPRRLLDVEQPASTSGTRWPEGPRLDLLRLHADGHPRQGPEAPGRHAPRVQLHRLLRVRARTVGPQPARSSTASWARPRRTSSGTTSSSEVIDGYQPDILWQDFNLDAVARDVAAELPVVLLQPGRRLEQGGRRHLQGRLQQQGRGLRLRARRPGRPARPRTG